MHKLFKKLEELLLIDSEDQNSTYEQNYKDDIIATNEALLAKELIVKELDEKIIDKLDDEEDISNEIEQSIEYEIMLKKLHAKVRTRYEEPTKVTEEVKTNLIREENGYNNTVINQL